MSGLSVALIAVYWVSVALSLLGVGSVAWVVSRSVLMTGFVSMVWFWVSVWLFGIYRVVLKTGAIL